MIEIEVRMHPKGYIQRLWTRGHVNQTTILDHHDVSAKNATNKYRERQRKQIGWRQWWSFLFTKHRHREERYHAVCAAVSTVEYQFLYAVKQMTKVRFSIEIKEGWFDFCTEEECRETKEPDLSIFCVLGEALRIGLDMIHKKHPNQTRLNIVHVTE